MNKLYLLKNLCQDTYERCFGFVKDPQQNHKYQKVELINRQEEEENAEREYFADWPTQASIYKSSPPVEEKLASPPPVIKKNVLIGNYDEEMLAKKREEEQNANSYDDLFGDVPKPSFDQKLGSFTKNSNKQTTSNKTTNQTTAKPDEKFKMDDDLKAEEGWGEEDYEIRL